MHNQSAPDCPWWCTATHGESGWDDTVDPLVTKRCARPVPTIADVDGEPLIITVERFASMSGATLTIEEPVIRIEGHGPLKVSDALVSAHTVLRVAEMVNEPPPIQLAG